MVPRSKFPDCNNSWAAEAKLPPHCSNRAAARGGADFSHVGFGDFGVGVLLSPRCIAVPFAVFAVLLVCSPSEVGSAVVVPIRVGEVSSNASVRTWADKRFENDLVYRDVEFPSVIAKNHEKITGRVSVRFEPSPVVVSKPSWPFTTTGPYGAVIANSISRKPWNDAVLNGRFSHHESPAFGFSRPVYVYRCCSKKAIPPCNQKGWKNA